MKVRTSVILLCACLALLGAGRPAPIRVPQAQVAAENARWSALGVHLPPHGIVLPDPYAAPYSNQSFVVPFAWYEQFYRQMRVAHDYPVEASALREDLPTLRFLLEKAYAGYDTAKSRGWNWDSWFREWDNDLARHGSAKLSLREAFAPWGRLEAVQLDNHSGVPSLADYVSGSVSSVLTSAPGAPCTSLRLASGRDVSLSTHDPAQQPHAVQAWNGSSFSPAWYVSYPKRTGTIAAIQCGAQRISLAPAWQPPMPALPPVYQSIDDGIAYVRMPTFTDANDDALRAALSKAQGLGKERVVVLDLRGNDGGNAPADVLTNWFAESAIEQASASATQYGTNSCFRTALFFGLQQQLLGGVKAPVSPQLQQALQSLVDAIAAPSTNGCAVERTVQRGDRSLGDHHFSISDPVPAGQVRIVALVDNGCGSDCEYMTYVLSGLPGTVIAGTSTYGVMGFTQPGYFVLPHSRVPFRIALSRTDEYGDGRSVDGYGITVDVLLATKASQDRASIAALAKALSGT
jgi:hypothetical protein